MNKFKTSIVFLLSCLCLLTILPSPLSAKHHCYKTKKVKYKKVKSKSSSLSFNLNVNPLLGYQEYTYTEPAPVYVQQATYIPQPVYYQQPAPVMTQQYYYPTYQQQTIVTQPYVTYPTYTQQTYVTPQTSVSYSQSHYWR